MEFSIQIFPPPPTPLRWKKNIFFLRKKLWKSGRPPPFQYGKFHNFNVFFIETFPYGDSEFQFSGVYN